MKSWIDISSSKLADNIRAIGDAAGPGVEMMAVIKADGYGHSAELIAPVLAGAGVHWLGVSDLEEGERVRSRIASARILVMYGSESDDAQGIVKNGLTPVVWTPEHISFFEEAARAAGRRISVHLEVETGMARQGAAPGAEFDGVLARLQGNRWVDFEGLMTHLCEAEVADSAITAAQLARFEQAIAQVVSRELRPKFLHIGNSSSVDEGSTLPWVKRAAEALGARPMVRPGLAIYGHCLPVKRGAANLAPHLQPVLVWKTRILGCREIGAGATVGYGATFIAQKPMRLALLPVGYADGFRRAASSGLGNGWVLVRDQRAPVVGRVSMNLIVVDVTEIESVRVGEEVILLGPGVTADDHATWARTISYDILCGIRARFELR